MAHVRERPIHFSNQGRDSDWINRLAGRVRVVDGCWLYGSNPDQYAFLKIEGRDEAIHRLVYLSINGHIEQGHHVHHTCEQPACINPDHLVALSPGDHMREHARLRRQRAA